MPDVTPEQIQRMYEDMYIGHGKLDPPVTTRLDRIEQILSDLKSWKWVLVGATLTMIADLVIGHIK